MEEPRQEALLVEYSEVNQNFRSIADTRFKLLAFIPSLGAVALFLLSRVQQGESEPKLGYGLLLLISCLGFLFTLGVTFYDLRNTELYIALVVRARYLEEKLKLPPNIEGEAGNASRLYGGQFHERPVPGGYGRYLFGVFEPDYDTGLAFIYGAVLGAWFYPLTSALLGWVGLPSTVRLVTSSVVAVVLFVRELLRLEGGSFRRLLRWWSPNNPSARSRE
jgi:hypothetical protein